MLTPQVGPSSTGALFELSGFAALLCGCVAGGYVVRSLELDVVALEVKGPRAPHHRFAAGVGRCGRSVCGRSRLEKIVHTGHRASSPGNPKCG